MNALIKRWDDFWFPEYSSRGLALFRILLCFLIFKHFFKTEMVHLIFMDELEDYFARGFYSPYFDWFTPPSYEIFVWLWRICFVSAFAALIGFMTRISFAVAVAIFAYVFLLNQFFYYNHLYSLMIALFLAIFMPLNETFSADAWMARVRGRNEKPFVVSWAARLLQVIVSIIYLGSAVSKTNSAWLSGDLLKTFFEFGHEPGMDGSFAPPAWLGFVGNIPFSLQAVASLAVEYFLGIGLWIRRLRPWALIVGVVFHIFILLGMDVSSFSWQMFVYYLLFMVERKPHQGKRF